MQSKNRIRVSAHVLGWAGLLWGVFALPTQDLLAGDAPPPAAEAATSDQKDGQAAADSGEGRPLKDLPVGPFRLDVGGSLRFRFEHQRNFNAQRYADTRTETYDEDGFLLQRARLNLNLRLAEGAHVYTEIQDSRAYDSDFREEDFFTNNPYWNDADLRQMYVEWLRIGDSAWGIKVGRQTIFYGDNRIWGPGDWGNVGRYTWDAAKVILDLPFAETHLLAANRVRYEPHSFDPRDGRLDAYGAYAMVKNLPMKLDFFWVGKYTDPDLVVNAQGDRLDLDTHTLGGYIAGKVKESWDYAGTLAHTSGDRNGDSVDAWGANARLGYTFDAPWEPRIGGEFSYGSGPPAGGRRLRDLRRRLRGRRHSLLRSHESVLLDEHPGLPGFSESQTDQEAHVVRRLAPVPPRFQQGRMVLCQRPAATTRPNGTIRLCRRPGTRSHAQPQGQ